MSDSFRSHRAPAPVGLYPHARRVGHLLFLSGVGPRQPGTDEIPGVARQSDGRVVAHDIELQARATFDNVRWILQDAGSGWDRLVDVTVFLTDMQADFATYNRVWAEYFAVDPPARTTVEVKALPTPIAIELKCIATID